MHRRKYSDKYNPSKHVVVQHPPKASTKTRAKPPTESPAKITAKICAKKNRASAKICAKICAKKCAKKCAKNLYRKLQLIWRIRAPRYGSQGRSFYPIWPMCFGCRGGQFVGWICPTHPACTHLPQSLPNPLPHPPNHHHIVKHMLGCTWNDFKQIQSFVHLVNPTQMCSLVNHTTRFIVARFVVMPFY